METLFWLIFLMNELPRKIRIELLEKYKKPEKILKLNKENLIKENIKEELITDDKIRKSLEYLTRMEKNNVKFISIYDSEYPEILRNIYDPPIGLFIKGNEKILNDKIISIVGCRLASDYGRMVATDISSELAKRNYVIASGLARGIDSFAHLGALNVNGKTIAILGNGINIIYPRENEKLYDSIIKNNGVIISEYLLDTKPNKKNFPERNRIISGISHGLVVVEAKERSGTLITADFALEQGREIYAVPGNIYSNNSYGTNELIKQGAKMVTNVFDILEDFAIL